MDTKSTHLKITAVSLILGVLFDYFFYDKVPGLSFPVYVALIVAGLFVLAASLGKQINKQVVWLLLPLAFFSTMVFMRDSAQLTFLNVVTTLALLLLVARLSFGGSLKNFFIVDYAKSFLLLPLRFIPSFFGSLARIVASRAGGEGPKVSPQIIKGIVITVPILAVLVLLFSSADLIFQKHLKSLIDIQIDAESIIRAVLILGVSFVFLGAYAHIFCEKQDENVVERTSTNFILGPIESSILLGSVNALFLIFIVLQIAYLFGGQSNISMQGFTYADYARRGFFELIGVAVFSLLLLLGVEKVIVRKDSGHTLLFKVLGGALILQVMIVMASAFKRLLLYEEAYGFTASRFYSHAFIVLLGVVFVLLLYKIYSNKRENIFAFSVFVPVLAFLAVLNLVNPDAFIARRNIERFRATGKLDEDYLRRLSDDAAAEISKVIHLDPREASDQPWQSLNLSRMRAQKIR